MANDNDQIFAMAGGDVLVWVEAGGAICMKLNTEFNDPTDMSEEEALELGQLLVRLAQEQMPRE